jgi:hypothetical protein
MKHLLFYIILFSVGCHCGSDRSNVLQNQAENNNNTVNTSEEKAVPFDYPFSEKPQVFKLKKNKPTHVQTKKGVKINIDASSLVHADGSPVTGDVELRVSEVFSKKDFVTNNCQTVSDGKLLVSGGSVNVQAYEGGKELQLKQGNNYKMEVPVQTKQPMELFEGTRDVMGNMNWKPIGKKLEIAEKPQEPIAQNEEPDGNSEEVDTTQVTRERKFLDIRGGLFPMSADEFKSYSGFSLGEEPEDDYNTISKKELRKEARKQKRMKRKIAKQEKLYYKPVEIGTLGWVNIDAFIKDGRVTDGYKIHFKKGSPGVFGTYLIFNTLNSTIAALNKTNVGEEEVLMNNQLPVGERVKIIIYTKKEDEVWHYKLDTLVTKDMVIEPVFTKAKMADFQRVVTN